MKWTAFAVVAACHSSSPNPSPTASLSPTPSLSQSATPASPKTVVIDARGVGFDDLVFAGGQVLAPAGMTGNLVSIDPATRAMKTSRASSEEDVRYQPGRHDVGITSVAVTPAHVVVTDRTAKTLVALDSGKTQPLAAEPDYVRFIDALNEVWVTEPDAAQIEVIHVARVPSDPPFLRLMMFPIPGGPESLVVSASRSKAYSNLWHAKTVEIDVAKHAITRTFDSACDKTRGIALDDASGGLFVACNDGRIVRVDLTSGKIVAEGRAGDGVDIIDFSPKTGHLYVPASRAGTLTVFDAKLSIVKTAPIPKGAHCVVADDRSQAWGCDPDHGSLVVFSENP